MKKYSVFLLLMLFVVPSVAFASWWNPFSWFKKQVVQIPIVQVSIPTPIPVSDKQTGEEKIIPKKEKQKTQSTTKQITPSLSTTSSGGGNSPLVMVGPCPVVGPCTATPIVIDNNSTPSPTLPENAGCDSGTGFSSITGMPCNGTTPAVSNTTQTVSLPITTIKKQKIVSKAQPTIISTPTPPPTYKELHCPQITSIKDSLGNVGYSPFQGAGIKGSFAKGETSSITLDITATDPQGLPVYFKISSDWPNDSTDWSLKNTYTFDVSNSSKGVHIVAIEIDNQDGFKCIQQGDALRQLEYSVY